LALGVAACSPGDGDGGNTTTGPGTGKCAASKGANGRAIELSATLNVVEASSAQPVSDGQTMTISAAELSVGDVLDTKLRITNTAAVAAAKELKIVSAKVAYTPPSGADDGATPAFACVVIGGDKTAVPCDGFAFPPIVPGGFDPACATSAPAAEQVVNIRFTRPKDQNPRTATFTLEVANDPKRSKLTVNLVTTAGTPKLSVVPPHLEFEDVKLDATVEKPATLTNTGTAPLSVGSLAFNGDSSGNNAWKIVIAGKEYKGAYQGAIDPPVVIEANASVDMVVSYTAIDGNGHQGSYSFGSNDASGNKSLQVQGNPHFARIAVTPSKVNFGFVPLGTIVPRTLEIKSTGDQEAQIFGVVLSDDEADVFKLDFKDTEGTTKDDSGKPVTVKPDPVGGPSDAKPMPLAVNAKAQVKITCTPAAMEKEAYTATVTVKSNSLEQDKVVPLVCSGSSTNCPTPIIDVQEGEAVVPQTLLHLSSSSSFAGGAGKAISKWKWSVKQPDTSSSLLYDMASCPSAKTEADLKNCKASDSAQNVLLQANVAGTYAFSLDIWDNDDVEGCAKAQAVVNVIPDQSLHVELTWDTPQDQTKADGSGSDMDLHFAHPNAIALAACKDGQTVGCGEDLNKDGVTDPWFDQPFDCFWYNAVSKWGDPMSPADDPSLDRDDVDGWGPENMNMQTPEELKEYMIGVHYWDDHSLDVSTPTVRVYLYGQLAFEKVGPVMKMCDMWWVARIPWPPTTSSPVVEWKDPVNLSAKAFVSHGYIKKKFGEALGAQCKAP